MRLDLAHIAGSTFNVPLLMHRRRLDATLATLGPRILDGTILRPGPDADKLRTERPERHAALGSTSRRYVGGGYLADAGIGVLPVLGTLLRRGSWLDAECGLMSYGLLRQSVDAILDDPSTRGLLVEYDTPGGEAGGCFDLADYIVAKAGRAGKPVWAHVNELAASAGYALASTADQIWIPTTGEVGSIGVVAAHVDVSKADEKAGVKWTYIYEGDHKVDGNPHEPLNDAAEASIREDVSELYGLFVELVARNRAMTADDVRATEALTYRGATAVEVGLADEVGSLDDALEAFAVHLDEMQTSSGSRVAASRIRKTEMTKTAPKATTEADKPEDVAPAPAPVAPAAPEAPAPLVQPAPAAPDAAAQAAAAERTRCAEIYGIGAQATRLGVEFDASAAITGGVTVEAARKSVMDKAAEKDTAQTVTTHKNTTKPSAEVAKSAWSKALKGK